jgi:hypothetical protein
MSLLNLFENRAYLLNSNKEIENEEIEIINIILSSLKKPMNATDLELISINDDYDTYKFNFKNSSFCIKISLDGDCASLKNEYESLRKINKLICANLIKYGKIKIGDEISYLITTYENAESVFQLGRSLLINNFDSFCDSYLELQKSKPLKNNFKNHFNDIIKMIDIKSYFLEDSLSSILNYTDLEKIYEILNSIKEEINLIYKKIPKCNKYICHGNLNYNNVITRNEVFKFINFDKSFQSHCFLDFSHLMIELGTTYELESHIFKDFCNKMNIEYNEKTLDEYKQYYEFSLRAKAAETLVNYLKEVYLYQSLRSDKIIKLCDRFSQGYDRYSTISILDQNKEFIIKTLTEPILGIKI